jgi:uncharacterized protein (TIGR00288 family)
MGDEQVPVRVAVFLDFENLVLGAGKGPGEAVSPVPYEALSRLCRDYGSATVRRAYANWADCRFGRYQDDLAMNGVELIQVGLVGGRAKNAADIQIAVDAMETLITHPDIAVYVLVTGDGDFTPLVRRLREFGKRVIGVGTAGNASRRLVAVSDEYRFWDTLVAGLDAAGRTASRFDISAAEQLLIRAFAEIGSDAPSAAILKCKMLALDATFSERNYGCSSFRDFLACFPNRIRQSGRCGNDLTFTLAGR